MKGIRLFAAFAAAAIVGACDAPTLAVPGFAYDPIGGVPLLYHWDAGHEIAIYVDPREEPEGADLDAAVRAAIAAWEEVAPLGEVKFKVVSDLHDADVIFHHSLAPRLVESDACAPVPTGAGGYTFFCINEDSTPVTFQLVDGTGGHVKMDVLINVGALDTASFFPALVVHEMGHVLGIGSHSPTPTDLMFGRPRQFKPTEADVATLRYVLSRRPDVRF